MKTLIHSGPSPTANAGIAFSTASVTRYLMLGGQLARYEFGYILETAEGDWRWAPDENGFIDDLAVRITANTRTTAVSFDLMVNGVSAGLTWTVGAGVTGWVEASGGPVAVSEDDLVSVRMVTGTGGGSITVTAIDATFTGGSGDTYSHVCCAGDYGIGQGTSTTATIMSIAGSSEGNTFASTWGGTTLSSNIAARFQLDATLESLRVHISANTSTADVEYELYVNAAASGLKVTVPAGVTGRFRGTGAVDIAPGDRVELRRRALSSGTGSQRVGNMQVGVRYDGEGFDVFGLSRPSSTLQGYNDNTYYIGIGFLAPSTLLTSVWTRNRLPEGTIERLWAWANVSGAAGGLWNPQEHYVNDVAAGHGLAIDGSVAGNRLEQNLVGTLGIDDHDGVSFAFRTGGFSQSISAWGFALTSSAAPPVEVDMFPGALELTGQAPTLQIDEFVDMEPGALVLEGQAPLVAVDLVLEVPAGQLVLQGEAPDVSVGITVTFEPGELELGGQAPFVSTDLQALATQQAGLLLAALDPEAHASQQAGLLLAEIIPDVAASQQAILILAEGSPCVTRRCQIWTITRRDGVVFRYTSHDQPVVYGGQTYAACRSLDPSASENASTLGSVGNIELEGIIDDDGISEADLYGGLFDDAYVTVDLISWGDAEAPRRLASGWTGELSQGDTGFRMEVLGAGARLDQQALVQMVTPGCRWVFGSAECGVDIEALAIGGTVTAASARGSFLAVLDSGDGGLQWANGTVRWTSGVNAGHVVEVKTVDFGSGQIVLWASPPYLPEAGDAFDLLPGCDKIREGGCTVYSNVINFGGFPDVPGGDSLLETPDAKY